MRRSTNRFCNRHTLSLYWADISKCCCLHRATSQIRQDVAPSVRPHDHYFGHCTLSSDFYLNTMFWNQDLFPSSYVLKETFLLSELCNKDLTLITELIFLWSFPSLHQMLETDPVSEILCLKRSSRQWTMSKTTEMPIVTYCQKHLD